jgi:anoctamin-10
LTWGERVAEWLHGVRLAAPDEETKAAIDEETLTDAERLRVVHHLITSPEREGGAGVTPGLDGWNYVESIFPLHDSKFNRVYFLTDRVDE